MQITVIPEGTDRKSTRLNSSHPSTSYAVFCLKKNKYIRRSSLATRRSTQNPPHGQKPLVAHLGLSGANLLQTGCKPGQAFVSFVVFLKNGGPPEASPFPHQPPLRS